MTTDIQTQTMHEMQSMAKRLKEELEAYLEDLELFSKPEFWEAVKSADNGKKFHTIQELRDELGI